MLRRNSARRSKPFNVKSPELRRHSALHRDQVQSVIKLHLDRHTPEP
jgi:hypothetical protein